MILKIYYKMGTGKEGKCQKTGRTFNPPKRVLKDNIVVKLHTKFAPPHSPHLSVVISWNTTTKRGKIVGRNAPQRKIADKLLPREFVLEVYPYYSAMQDGVDVNIPLCDLQKILKEILKVVQWSI